MKYLLKNIVIKNLAIIVITIILLSFLNCTSETANISQESSNISLTQDPAARITNNGDFDINLDIYNVNGELVASEYNIKSGTTSNWKSFASGEITFVINNSNFDKIVVLDMNKSMAYDMVIDSDNQLASTNPIQL